MWRSGAIATGPGANVARTPSRHFVDIAYLRPGRARTGRTAYRNVNRRFEPRSTLVRGLNRDPVGTRRSCDLRVQTTATDLINLRTIQIDLDELELAA